MPDAAMALAPSPGLLRDTSGPEGHAPRRLAVPLAGVVAVAALVGLASVRWDAWRSEASLQVTDNALVRAETTRLSARVAGNVARVLVADFQRVRAGDLLVEIAPEDYEAQTAQAEASVAAARAALDNLGNQVALQRAGIAQAEAQREAALARQHQAALEFGRQQALVASSFGTRQKLEAATADQDAASAALQASEAQVQAQRRQIDVLEGQRHQREAELQAAQANLQAARLRLGYTRVVAPVDGVVGERAVQPGDYVTVGSTLIAVVPLPDVHVIANYKETQLTHVAPGQPADVTVDMFPASRLRGHVERLSPQAARSSRCCPLTTPAATSPK
ncbi:HlyD family secretion protein [Dankookia sp. P2]|uniref:HlyD family secretion protein n=1 Tax=Dankookia sp. P2 TaxID=3423955 RepID=UPI003D6663F6